MSSLRFIFFVYVGPTVIILVLGSLAMQEWSKISKFKQLSADFYRNSTPVVFKDVGEQPLVDDSSSTREYSSYEFEWEGEKELFQCRYPIDLPRDGRVRIGEDPVIEPQPTSIEMPLFELGEPKTNWIIAVPLHDGDGLEAVYTGLRGHPVRKDVIKASAVSAGSLVTVLVAFLLRGRISRESGIGAFPQWRSRRKPVISKKEKTNIQALGVIHLIFGPLSLIGVFYIGMIRFSESPMDATIWVILAYGVTLSIAMVASGVGILARKRWALPWMKIAGLGLLIGFPIWTIIGIWTLMIHNRLSHGR